MMKPDNILPADGEVYFYPDFFDAVESAALFAALQQTIKWKQEPIIIMGRQLMQPRLTALYGDADKTYRYSGLTMTPNAWTPELLHIKNSIEKISPIIFSTCLLNYYRDGNDSMGWHRDNEKELGINPVIGSVSFGAPRAFAMKHLSNKTFNKKLLLTPGSFLLMAGSTQHHWYHSIPKTKRVAGGRINLTFRKII